MAELEVERLRHRVAELEAEKAALRQARDDAVEQQGRRFEALLSELQHRVKNMLAVVRAVVARTAETSENVEGFTAHLSGRLGALARVQGILTRTGEDAVGLDELVHDELIFHGGFEENQLSIEGPPVQLRGKAAQMFGLALHELATNAVKYGALSNDTGQLQVRWRMPHPAGDVDAALGTKLLLEWEESGGMTDGAASARHGFGRALIEQGLPYELNAITTLEFRPGGVRCTIEVPIASGPGNGPAGLLPVPWPLIEGLSP